MPTKPKEWTRLAREARLRGPWKPDEDAELIKATRCGVSLDYVTIGERTLPEILERRRELIEAGAVSMPRPI